tara:strand:- start:522 stop:1436 length:915 start_codon:yes stop_codon:yes gene_type:complete
MAELIDLNKEFHLGNKFTLDAATHFSKLLDDRYRVIVKYDSQDLPEYNDDKLNILIATSRENHQVPNGFFRDDVFLIFQHYHMLDRWDHYLDNPLSFPLPLGPFCDCYSDIEIRPISQRKYDFTFIGQIPHTGTRDCFKRGLDKLCKESGDKFKYKIQFTDSFGGGVSPREYMQILADSKLSLCPAGAYSMETFRFFESSLMGAIPVVERLPKFWYYEESSFFKGPWDCLDNTLSKSLNFLQCSDCRPLLQGLAKYNQNTLTAKGLALKMKSIVQARHSNIQPSKSHLKNLREQLSYELESDKL